MYHIIVFVLSGCFLYSPLLHCRFSFCDSVFWVDTV